MLMPFIEIWEPGGGAGLKLGRGESSMVSDILYLRYCREVHGEYLNIKSGV